MPMDQWPRRNVSTLADGLMVVEVYERSDRLVTGPCVSMNVATVEVLRIDLPHVPAGKCHEHWSAIPNRPRMFYPPEWERSLLVELAVWNLAQHTPMACALEGLQAPSRSVLVEASEWARPLLEAL